MLEDIRNEHVLTLEVDRGEDLREQLAGLTDERLAPVRSSFAPGASPTHMNSAFGSPTPGTGFVRRRVERAAPARRDDVGDLLQRRQLRGRIVEQRAARAADHEPDGHVLQRRGSAGSRLRGRNVHRVPRRLRCRLRVGSSGHRLLSLCGVQSGRSCRGRRRPRGSPARQSAVAGGSGRGRRDVASLSVARGAGAPAFAPSSASASSTLIESSTRSASPRSRRCSR